MKKNEEMKQNEEVKQNQELKQNEPKMSKNKKRKMNLMKELNKREQELTTIIQSTPEREWLGDDKIRSAIDSSATETITPSMDHVKEALTVPTIIKGEDGIKD